MKPSFYLYAFVVFLLVFGLVKAARAGGEDFTTPDRPIECEALIPADLEPVHGWKVVRAEDRLHISEQMFKGKATMQKRQTLLCRDVSGGKVTSEFTAYQWWWKVKR